MKPPSTAVLTLALLGTLLLGSTPGAGRLRARHRDSEHVSRLLVQVRGRLRNRRLHLLSHTAPRDPDPTALESHAVAEHLYLQGRDPHDRRNSAPDDRPVVDRTDQVLPQLSRRLGCDRRCRLVQQTDLDGKPDRQHDARQRRCDRRRRRRHVGQPPRRTPIPTERDAEHVQRRHHGR